jgi:hypothetical protein
MPCTSARLRALAVLAPLVASSVVSAAEPPAWRVHLGLAMGACAFMGEVLWTKPVQSSPGPQRSVMGLEISYVLYGLEASKGDTLDISYLTRNEPDPPAFGIEAGAGEVLLLVLDKAPSPEQTFIVFDSDHTGGIDLGYKVSPGAGSGFSLSRDTLCFASLYTGNPSGCIATRSLRSLAGEFYGTEGFALRVHARGRVTFSRPRLLDGKYAKWFSREEATRVVKDNLARFAPRADVAVAKGVHWYNDTLDGTLDEIQAWLVSCGLVELSFTLDASLFEPPLVREYNRGMTRRYDWPRANEPRETTE